MLSFEHWSANERVRGKPRRGQMKKLLEIAHRMDDYACMWNGVEDLYIRDTGETLPPKFFYVLSGFGSFCYIQHRRFLSQRLLRRSFWREQYRAVLLPNHRLRQDTSSKPGRAYIQPTHKSCSYRNAVLICSTKSPYFVEILRNLLTNQSVVLYHMNTTEVSLL